MTDVEHLAYVGTGEDANGNAVSAWASPRTVTSCTFAPNGSSELDDGRTQQTPHLFVQVAVSVTPRDRFRIGDVTYEVDGQPELWSDDPFGTGWKPSDQLVPLKVVS